MSLPLSVYRRLPRRLPYSLGFKRYSLYFDGSSYVEVPPINGLSEFTIEALFYMESDGGMIFDKDFTDPGYRYGILILPEAYGRKVRLHYGVGTNFQWVDSLTSIETHRWYYIAVTYRAGDVARFYINGIFDVERSVTNGVVEGRTTTGIIGARQDLNAGFFKGRIPLLRIYSRVLSEREIRYNMLNYHNPVRDGLVLWLHDRITADTWYDESGMGNHGAIHGAVRRNVSMWEVRAEVGL